MSFPSSPSNNQTSIVNGITFTYNSSRNTWTRQQTAITASSGLDDYARTTANTATSNIVILQGVDTSQNTRLSVVEGGLISANANTVYLNSLITTNNTRISVIEGGLISANANSVFLNSLITTNNTRISVIEGGLISANANTVFLNSLITTNNTRISSTDNTATAAYAKANAAFDKANTGSGSSSGYLANSVIIANTTGYLTNTSSIQFFTSNNNLVLTGNIIAGGVRNTTSSSAPANPTVGDIWYKTTNDKVYRYTYDGTGSYWIDVNTPTVAANGSVSIDSLVGAVITSSNSITGTTTLTTASLGLLNICTGTSANYTVTLPSASSSSGKTIGLQMGTATTLTKLVTISAAGSDKIDGSTTRIMWSNETAVLFSDGTNWYKTSGKTIPMVAGQTVNATQSIATGPTAYKKTLGTVYAANCPSAMNDTANSRVIIQRASIYNVIASTRIFNLTTGTNLETFIYIDSTEQGIHSRYSTVGDYCAMSFSMQYTLNSNQVIEVYARQYSGGNQTYLDNNMNNLFVTEIPQW